MASGAHFAVYPDDGLVCVFLSNREEGGAFDGIDRAAADIVLP